MRALLFVVGFLLLLALAPMPYGYYEFLRVVVTVVAGIVILRELGENSVLWLITFALIAALFNPLFIVHFDRKVWAVIDMLAAGIFLFKAFKWPRSIRREN